jgi:hypothetical protein
MPFAICEISLIFMGLYDADTRNNKLLFWITETQLYVHTKKYKNHILVSVNFIWIYTTVSLWSRPLSPIHLMQCPLNPSQNPHKEDRKRFERHAFTRRILSDFAYLTGLDIIYIYIERNRLLQSSSQCKYTTWSLPLYSVKILRASKSV